MNWENRGLLGKRWIRVLLALAIMLAMGAIWEMFAPIHGIEASVFGGLIFGMSAAFLSKWLQISNRA